MFDEVRWHNAFEKVCMFSLILAHIDLFVPVISMDMVEALVEMVLNHLPGLESFLRRQNEVAASLDGQMLSSR